MGIKNSCYIYTETFERRKRIAEISLASSFAITASLLLFMLLKSVYAKDLLQTVFDGTDFISTLNKLFGKSSKYLGFVKRLDTGTFYKQVKNIALLICCFAFLVNLAEEVTRSGFTPAVFIRGIVLYAIVCTIITHAAELATRLDSLGNIFINLSRSWAGQANPSISLSEWNEIWDSQNKNGLLSWAGRIAVYLSLAVGMIFVKIRILQQGFARLIELGVLKLFLPLGIAWIPLNGIRGGGLSYMKYYVGVYIRIGVFYIIAALAAKFMTVSSAANIADFQTVCIIFSLCLLVPSMMSSSDSLVSRIVNI